MHTELALFQSFAAVTSPLRQFTWHVAVELPTQALRRRLAGSRYASPLQPVQPRLEGAPG